MNTYFLATVAICAYTVSTVKIIRLHHQSTGRIPQAVRWAFSAIALHIISLTTTVLENDGFNFSLFSMASLVSLIVALLLTSAMLSKPVENLGIFVFPIAALMLILDICFPEKQRSLNTHSWQLSLHVLSSIIAFSLLNIAALQAVLLVVQNQQLRSHPPKRYIQSMPSLETMESLLFQMIGAGLIFLSTALISGFMFVDDIFAQHQAHKTFLSILAWLIFSGLLIGRKRYGWRGQTAIKWTLVGFVFLLLAYFGSKLVKELILHR
ncbi:MAG: cytochrome c biogenesis protein CcsA [Methylococcaceae bacterium]|nr:cytochrome c biogenesis protein CcsA [Methylococcaceae bacterium]